MHLVVRVDKFSSYSEETTGSPRQVRLVLLLLVFVYRVTVHPRPIGHSPVHALPSKIGHSNGALGISSVVDPPVKRI